MESARPRRELWRGLSCRSTPCARGLSWADVRSASRQLRLTKGGAWVLLEFAMLAAPGHSLRKRNPASRHVRGSFADVSTDQPAMKSSVDTIAGYRRSMPPTFASPTTNRPYGFTCRTGGLDPGEILGLDRLRRPSRKHLQQRRPAGQRHAPHANAGWHQARNARRVMPASSHQIEVLTAVEKFYRALAEMGVPGG
jgi:hypothetical protein